MRRKNASILSNDSGFVLVMALVFLAAAAVLLSAIPASTGYFAEQVETFNKTYKAYYAALTGVERFKNLWEQYLEYDSLDGSVKYIDGIEGQVGDAEIEEVSIQCVQKDDSIALVKVTSTGKCAGRKMTVTATLRAKYTTEYYYDEYGQQRGRKVLNTVAVDALEKQNSGE